MSGYLIASGELIITEAERLGQLIPQINNLSAHINEENQLVVGYYAWKEEHVFPTSFKRKADHPDGYTDEEIYAYHTSDVCRLLGYRLLKIS